MKRLLLRNMWLISDRERAARHLSFHPKLTVIVGENDTGKSSAMKAIYDTFGATAAVVNPKWTEARTTCLIEFAVDDQVHFILKTASLFGVFDAKGRLIWRGTRIVSELGPFLAGMLNFNLELKSQQGDVLSAPPAYCFLPFYVDQDAGWASAWSSFSRLQMFRDYRRDAANFHSGIQPPDYYRAKGDLAEANKLIADAKVEKNALGRASKRMRAGREHLSVDLRPEAFGERIDALVAECNDYMRAVEKVQGRISHFVSERAAMVEQEQAARSAMQELEKDYSFALDMQGNLICPTCGTEHESSFLNRFGLITDVQSCREFLVEVRSEIARVDREIAKEREALANASDNARRINAILEERRGDIKLRDVLKGESERIVDAALEEEDQELDDRIANELLKADAAQEEMNSLTDKKRGAKIRSYYRDQMRVALRRLNVTLDEDDYKAIDGKISETGSDFPRALLAYYYSFLHTVSEFSSSCICPIVIDSPIQQDQDPSNANRVIDFAANAAPPSMQVILATVSAHGVKIEGDTITLKDKNRLLDPDQYEEASSIIQPLYAQLLQ